jgi:hypothetical protein
MHACSQVNNISTSSKRGEEGRERGYAVGRQQSVKNQAKKIQVKALVKGQGKNPGIVRGEPCEIKGRGGERKCGSKEPPKRSPIVPETSHSSPSSSWVHLLRC